MQCQRQKDEIVWILQHMETNRVLLTAFKTYPIFIKKEKSTPFFSLCRFLD